MFIIPNHNNLYSNADPPVVEDISFSDVTSSAMRVNWTEADTECEVTYNLTYSPTPLWEGDCAESNSINMPNLKDLTIYLTDLQPFTDYSICITTIISEDYISETSTCNDQTTEQAG